MKRLNDTEALTTRPMDSGLTKTTRVEKIGEAYVVRESTYNHGTGECHENTRIEGVPPRMTGPADQGLRGAMDYLKGKSR